MDVRPIEEYITQFPIYQYAFFSSAEVEFSDRVRAICRKECPRYGKSWSCPPAVGSVADCRARCLTYDDVLLFSTVAEAPEKAGLQEILKTRREHEKITAVIEKFIRDEGIRCYTLSSDSCNICEKCAYPRHGCLHPEAMHPCIESHGILVTKNVEEHCMDFYLGEQYVLWFAMIFMRETKLPV